MATRTSVNVTGPGGTSEEVRTALDGQTSRWSFADTHESGVYRVALGAPLNREEAFAVNVDTVESDLTRLPIEDLPKQFTTHQQNSLDEVNSPSISRKSGLHRNLLYGVLGLLVFEVFLAWRFGHSAQ